MYIQPDGIGIPGRVSAHVNTRTYIDACKFIRLYAFTLWNNSLEFVPFPIYLLPLPLPLSISLSFLPLLPSRRFSCKWHGLCLVHYYFFFSFFFFFILFSYLFTRAFHSFLTTRQPPPDYLDSSSRLISSRSYTSPPRNFILCFLISSQWWKIWWNIWHAWNHFILTKPL